MESLLCWFPLGFLWHKFRVNVKGIRMRCFLEPPALRKPCQSLRVFYARVTGRSSSWNGSNFIGSLIGKLLSWMVHCRIHAIWIHMSREKLENLRVNTAWPSCLYEHGWSLIESRNRKNAAVQRLCHAHLHLHFTEYKQVSFVDLTCESTMIVKWALKMRYVFPKKYARKLKWIDAGCIFTYKDRV